MYIIVICLVVTLLLLLEKLRGNISNNFPPGSKGFPYFGSFPFMQTHLERTLARWGWERYGSVFYFTTGGKRKVVLNTYEALREGFLKNSESLSSRCFTNHATESILFADYSSKWERQRQLRLLVLKCLKDCNVEELVLQECQTLCQHLKILPQTTMAAGTEMANHITLPTFNIISFLFWGKRLRNDKDDSKIIRQLTYPVYNTRPFSFWKLDQNHNLLRIKTIRRKIRSWKITEEIFSRLSNIDKNASDKCYTHENLENYILDLFIAGTDALATTLHWALVLLAANPLYQTKLQDEIDKVIGNNTSPSMQCLDLMPNTRATLQEVFRVRPVFPLSIPHKAINNVIIGKHAIPKGTTVVANLWAIQNDPTVWNEPEKFCPDRHLDDNGRFVKSDKVIPFSLGPRYCLGSQLSIMHQFLFLTSLLQKFNFELAKDKGTPNLSGSSTIVLAPVDIKLKIKHRQM
ncbi:unnamed protein product [Clavelina lepadiformis]|uniref:Cytochrome P450 n=1 Tax=Clavelina lepadiformis TaxID=159417 RepID=A0ABP0GU90_CLALP